MRIDIYQNKYNAIVNIMKYIIDLFSKKYKKNDNILQLFLVVVHHLRL